MNKLVKSLLAAGLMLGIANSALAQDKLKLGYLVKQPEEPWFQTEWAFADKAGKDLGFGRCSLYVLASIFTPPDNQDLALFGS